MSDLLHETTAPLAWDSDGMPFQLPSGTVAFKVRLYTGNRGRPGVVWGPQGPVHLDPGATMDELRIAVQHKPGAYRLYPVNEAGEELAPVACIEVTERQESEELAMMEAMDHQPARAPMPGLDRSRGPGPGRGHARGSAPGYEIGGMLDVNELFRHMLASQDEQHRQMSAIVHKLVDSTAMIQNGMAGLFKVTNDTIKVSSGLDAIGRLPAPREMDTEEIAEQLAEQLADLVDDGAPAPQPEEKTLFDKVGAVMKGPVGMFVMNLANNLTAPYVGTVQAQQAALQAFAKAEQAKAEAEAAEANATKEAIEEAMRTQEDDDEEFDEEFDEDDEASTEPASAPTDSAPGASTATPTPAPQPRATPQAAQTAEPGPRTDKPQARAATVHNSAPAHTLRERIAPSSPIHLPPVP